MNCPNFNIESVRDEFNRIVIAAGGEPLTIEEFKNKDLRNKRSGVDDLAMQVAYRKYDNNTNPNAVNYSLKAVNILMSNKAKQVFAKGEKAKWSLDKILTELAVPKEQKALLLDLGNLEINSDIDKSSWQKPNIKPDLDMGKEAANFTYSELSE